MNHSPRMIRLVAGIALSLILVACSGSSSARPETTAHDIAQAENRITAAEGGPGSTTLGVAEVVYQSWACREGLVLFRDALIGNQGEHKTRHAQWLSPIPCESAKLYLQN